MSAAWPSLALLFFTACSASHDPDGPGDARAELCVTHWLAFDYGQSIFVYDATPEGPARPIEVPVSEGPGEDRISAVTRLDVDGDGMRDVVVRNAYGGAALVDEPISLTVIRGSSLPFGERERLRFTSDARVSGGGGITALGDWDGDGREDLLAEWEGVVLLVGDAF